MSDHGVPAEPRLASINRQQLVLRSIDVEQLIDEEHSARLIWQLIGRLDLGLYHAQIEAVEGRAGREHTDPQLLISLWIYAYSRGLVRRASWRGSASTSRAASGYAGCRRSATGRCPVFVPIIKRGWTICSCRCWA